MNPTQADEAMALEVARRNNEGYLADECHEFYTRKPIEWQAKEIKNAINKATADLSTQLAERDAQLARLTDALWSVHWHASYGTQGSETFIAIVDNALSTRQPTQDKEPS